MKYAAALKACRKVGTAHATGDALRAMYANLVALQQGGQAERYYEWLQRQPAETDQEIAEAARPLLRDRALAWDVLIGAR